MLFKTTSPPAFSVLKSTASAFLAVTVRLICAPGSLQAQNFMTQDELLATIPGSYIFSTSNQDAKTPWVQA
ncbi:MAG: hypothetical protein ABJQ70_14505 [Roseobacter sp.]